MPEDPGPSNWSFPDPSLADEHGLVGVGADLEPATVLAAYRNGIFPMPLRRKVMGWWSPDPRGVLPLDGLQVSRSLRKSCDRFEVRVDTAFDEVLERCADPRRSGAWITRDIRAAYGRLHRMGWAHSVETWDPATGLLVGGLYGVAIGGLFAGESMFHTATDASKVALVGLVARLRSHGFTLLDVQWRTDHLATLGVIEMPRGHYLELLAAAVAVPATWDDPATGR
jgi:leucyl/phenylalanyl-tRNA---protein transferase